MNCYIESTNLYLAQINYSMKMKKTAVILINVGTPDEPTVKAVRRYLFEFLNDRRVIDIPLVWQKLLVNLIIVPFRAPKINQIISTFMDRQGFTVVALFGAGSGKASAKTCIQGRCIYVYGLWKSKS